MRLVSAHCMDRLWRRGGLRLSLFVAAVLLAASSGEGQERRVIALDAPRMEQSMRRKVLLCELVRQAFLMTARDEFDLSTRDGWLRETADVPGTKVDRFEMTPLVQPGGELQVRIIHPLTGEAYFAEKLPVTSPVDFDRAVTLSLEWSRDRFPAVFRAAGYSPPRRPAANKSDAKAGDAKEEAAAGLAEEPVPLEFVSLIGSLRRLHTALRNRPDSVELLARIAREYALLGSVCEVHWGTEHKTFKARALLYAERAIQLGPENARAAWSGALVRSLCGLDHLALQDVTRVESLQGTDPPAWASAVKAFARWDRKGLQAEIDNQTPLASYFGMLEGEIAGGTEERRQSAHRCFEASPECLRAVAALAEEPAIGLRRSLGGAQIRQFLTVFPGQLEHVPGLPPDVGKSLAGKDEPDGVSLQQAIARHVALVKGLRSPAARRDRLEPSLGVLATLTENLNFVHAVQMAATDRLWLGVDPAETILELEPLIEPHPARTFLRVFQQEGFQAQAAYNAVSQEVSATPLSQGAEQPLNGLGWLNGRDHPRQMAGIRSQRDDILPDLLLALKDAKPAAEHKPLLDRLREISPDCPAVIAAWIRLDWSSAAPHAADWEQRDPTPLVLRALAGAYRDHAAEAPGNLASAERCLKVLAGEFPSIEVQEELAKIYWDRDDKVAWKEALVRALDLPSQGLEHSSIAGRIAHWHMDQKEWNEALPFAQLSADSYSSYGLRTAARCYEGLEDWEQAERYQRANSERYDNAWADWYFWCRRTGRGEVEAAAEFARNTIAQLSPTQRVMTQETAVFFELEGEREKALEEHLQFINSEDEGTYAAMSAYLLADELNRTKQRETLLHKLLAPGIENSASLLCELATRPAPAGAKDSPALSDAELKLCHAWEFESGRMTNAAWFIGKLLLNRKRQAEAVPWLKRAASSPNTGKWTCVLATAELTRLGIEIPPRRDSEIDAELVPVLTLQRAAAKSWEVKDLAAAAEAIRKALELNPDWGGSWIMAARISAEQGELEEAIDHCSEFLKRIPGQPNVLTSRGKLYELAGRLPEAIRDYEAALATSPLYWEAHNNMAWIRAASADTQYRDGAKALEHARQAYRLGADPHGVSDVVFAAAHAEAGEFDQAVQRIMAALSNGKYPDKGRLGRWLDSYKQKKPYRRDPVVVPSK